MYLYIYIHIRSSNSKYLNISIQSAINTIVRAYRAAAEREIAVVFSIQSVFTHTL